MRSAFIALAVLTAAATPAQASSAEGKSVANMVSASTSDPQSIALARQFVDLLYPPATREQEYFNALRDGVDERIESEEDTAKRAVLRKDLERYVADATPVMRRHYSRIIDAYVQAYASEFTSDELRQMVAFAATPAGRHFLDDHKSMDEAPLVGEAVSAMMQELAPMYEAFYKARCQRAAQTRLAAGDKDAKCSMS